MQFKTKGILAKFEKYGTMSIYHVYFPGIEAKTESHSNSYHLQVGQVGTKVIQNPCNPGSPVLGKFRRSGVRTRHSPSRQILKPCVLSRVDSDLIVKMMNRGRVIQPRVEYRVEY